jgi:hypothetical protein
MEKHALVTAERTSKEDEGVEGDSMQLNRVREEDHRTENAVSEARTLCSRSLGFVFK